MLESIAEADRGEFISADELLQRLRRNARAAALEVGVTPRAAAQIERAARWWAENRPPSSYAAVADA